MAGCNSVSGITMVSRFLVHGENENLPRLSDENIFEYEVPLVSAFQIHKEVE